MKHELADLKVKAPKKGESTENMEKMNDRLRSELEQLQHYNQYLANECRKNDSLIDRQKSTLWKEKKTKTKASKKCLSEIRNKNIMNRPATLFKILLVKSSASKDQIKKHYHKMSLLTYPDADWDNKIFNTINRASQILTNDEAGEAYNKFGLDGAEKVMNHQNW